MLSLASKKTAASDCRKCYHASMKPAHYKTLVVSVQKWLDENGVKP